MRGHASWVVLGEHEIEVAGEQLGNGVLGLAVGDVDAELRVLFAHRGKGIRDQGQGRGLEAGYAQLAGDCGQ
jgi:hypothetical protein